MAIPTWQEIKDNRYWAIFDLFTLLAILAIMGSAFAVAVALIPVITSALALSLLPQFMASFLAFLPFIVSLALLVNFLFFNQFLIFRPVPAEYKIKFYFLELILFPFFLVKLNLYHYVASYFQWHFQQEKREEFNVLISVYLNCSVLIAFGLGIYLSFAILPTLISSLVMAASLPYAVVVLFAMLAAAILMTLTYGLLVLPIRIFNLMLAFKFWKDTDQYKDLFYHLAHYLVLLTGLGFTAYASYWLFPMILQSLLPLLPAATAGFTAVLICAGLVTLVMTALPFGVYLLGGVIRTLADGGQDKASKFTTAFKAFERDCRLSLLGAGSQLIDIQTELKADYMPSISFIEEQQLGSEKWQRVIGSSGTFYARVISKDGQGDSAELDDVFCSPPPGWAAAQSS